jgi:hypothetical protein
MTDGARRIRIERSGGFAGIGLTNEVTDPDDVRRLSEGIDARAPTGPSAARDSFVYRFELVDAEGESSQTVEVPETALSPQTRDLVARLLRAR